jgi:alcohol dehydrogenase
MNNLASATRGAAPILMTPFDFDPRTRVAWGEHAIDRLGEFAAQLSARRALIVTDPGIVAAGHVERGSSSLRNARIETLTFDGARENPTTAHVQQGVAAARDFQPDLLIGLGGGSSMDCAKGINFIYSCGGVMKDYWGVGKAQKEMLPMIAVPTTAGTGSELQSFALISDAETNVKMACGDKKASFRIAILDPCLTLTQPAQVTALTGIDALSHAVETYVTTKRNQVSMLFSRESFRLIAGNLRRVVVDGDDLAARAAMQLGASYAGFAIENSMLGASHALANPLTATFGIAHGQAVGLMLPHVVRFNGQLVGKEYQELLASVFQAPTAAAGSEGLIELITELILAAGLEVQLRNLGVSRDSLPKLAEGAAQQWTGFFNPRKVNQGDLLEIYENAF